MKMIFTKYGVQAKNQRAIVMRATFANLISALFSLVPGAPEPEERNEATFIFFACSRILFSCSATAYM